MICVVIQRASHLLQAALVLLFLKVFREVVRLLSTFVEQSQGRTVLPSSLGSRSEFEQLCTFLW